MLELARRTWRLAAIIAWFGVTGTLALPQLWRGWPGKRLVSRITRMWGAGIARIMGIKIKVVGGDPGECRGGLIVSNHLGYVDVLVHAAVFPVRFTPKAEIRRWPILGWTLALNQPIWIERGSRQAAAAVVAQIHETMRQGLSLLVYPEGTSSDGAAVLPFKSAPFEAVVKSDAPIYPIATKYREVPGRDSVCWYGDMTLLPHVWKILAYPAIEVELRLLPPIHPNGRGRKEIAAVLEEAIRGELARP